MENDSTFVAPEGVYSITEQFKPNPLTISTAPVKFATKLSAIVVRFPNNKQSNAPAFAHLLNAAGGNSANKDVKKDLRGTKEREDGVSLSSSDTPDDGDNVQASPQDSNVPTSPGAQPPSHEHHTLFSHPPLGGKKKQVSRPKHNMRTTSSKFVTRLQAGEGLTKMLQSKQGDVTFMFYNTGTNYVWVEAGSKAKEPLSKITFSAYPTCHDVNASTASPERLDVIIGFNTGDLIWLDPISCRYGRLNKQGCITSSPCTAVRWIPSSTTLFLVSYADGTIAVYDKEREDGVFTPQDPSTSNGTGVSLSEEGSSQKEWDPTDNIFVTMPPWHPVASSGGGPGTAGVGLSAPGKADQDKTAKNPVSHWRVSKRSVVDFVFSPDVKYVAAISEDGCLRVIDALAEQLVDCYASYFGALTCVAWSPDGRFILTGGQDDLLTIFSPWEQRVVARCQGHSSFVSAVAFDDIRCDGRTYRFGSVGEDNKLILWDFSSGALHRPKLQSTHHPRASMASTVSLAARRDRSAAYLPSPASPTAAKLNIALTTPSSSTRYHPAPSRNEIAVVQPVLSKHIENDLLTGVAFLPRCIITTTKAGHVKLWVRPLAHRAHSHTRSGTTAAQGTGQIFASKGKGTTSPLDLEDIIP